MAFFDKIGSATDIHSPSAEKIGYRIEQYWKSLGMGNIDAVLGKLSAQDISMAVLYDTLNDSNPSPASKQGRLGKALRAALVAARPGKDSSASLDSMAWGAAQYVYRECKGMEFFKKGEYSTPFFQQLAGIVVTEGLKGVANVALTYVMKDPTYGKIASDMTGTMLAKVGQSYLDRLTTLFDLSKIPDPDKWASRKETRDKVEKIKKDTLVLEGARIQNAIQQETLNAKLLAFQMRQLDDREKIYNASGILAEQQGFVDEGNAQMQSLSQQSADQKKQASKRVWLVAGAAGLLVLALGGAVWLNKSSAQA